MKIRHFYIVYNVIFEYPEYREWKKWKLGASTKNAFFSPPIRECFYEVLKEEEKLHKTHVYFVLNRKNKRELAR